MRHIHEISSISQLDYPDSFSIQATDDSGSILWKRRFPNLVIQAYYANNDSFILIKNSRTITNNPSSYMEGVKLITKGEEEVENHILLALLHSPQPPSSVPLLDHIDAIPPSPVWPLMERNQTVPFDKPVQPQRHLSMYEQAFILSFIVVFVFIMYYAFKWFESVYSDPEETDSSSLQLTNTNQLIDGVLNSRSVTPQLGPAVDPDLTEKSKDFSLGNSSLNGSQLSYVESLLRADPNNLLYIPLNGFNLPIRTGLYQGEFVVCPLKRR